VRAAFAPPISGTLPAVAEDDSGIRDRLSRQGEEALGRIAVDRLDERLESIERGVSGLDETLGELGKNVSKPARASRPSKAERDGQDALAARLEEIGRDLAALRAAVAPGEEPPPRAQERLTVTE
jgi:hypothetical protein